MGRAYSSNLKGPGFRSHPSCESLRSQSVVQGLLPYTHCRFVLNSSRPLMVDWHRNCIWMRGPGCGRQPANAGTRCPQNPALRETVSILALHSPAVQSQTSCSIPQLNSLSIKQDCYVFTFSYNAKQWVVLYLLKILTRVSLGTACIYLVLTSPFSAGSLPVHKQFSLSYARLIY